MPETGVKLTFLEATLSLKTSYENTAMLSSTMLECRYVILSYFFFCSLIYESSGSRNLIIVDDTAKHILVSSLFNSTDDFVDMVNSCDRLMSVVRECRHASVCP